jgi:hypothetical protein
MNFRKAIFTATWKHKYKTNKIAFVGQWGEAVVHDELPEGHLHRHLEIQI